MDDDLSKIEPIISKYEGKKEFLIAILQEIQEKYNYLPKNALIYVSEKLSVPLIQVYSVATFYKTFSLKPKGKHQIVVCMGTACHVRGAPKILEEFERKLNIPCGETTPDGEFSLESVACLGCCAIGPVVVVDVNYPAQTTIRKIDSILKKYQKKEKDNEGK